ncbi:MAG TPA: hypothetical protein VJC37_06770 [Planctomycetota bacterium]|nr:hypothetical protein [Planctomycetota bacterium]
MSDYAIIGLVFVGVVVGFGIPIYLGLILYRKYTKSAEVALGVILSSYPKYDEGTMYSVTFHTYYGFLAWATQTKLIFPFDPNNIEPTVNLLRSLLKYNFKWGFLAEGALFIPVLSYFEYRKNIKTLRTHQLTDKQK